ncbi:unnamed protein product [Rotaria socialis]
MLQTATIQLRLLNAKPLGQQPITPHHYYQQQHQHTSKFNNNLALIDTGSAITIIHENLLNIIPYKTLIRKTIQHLSANCSTLNIIGELQLEININGLKTKVTADVATNLVTDLILGNDWIQPNNVYILTPEKRIMIRRQETDHEPLVNFSNKEQLNKRCNRWRLKLAEYRIHVKHIQGKKNNVADYLSRSPVEAAEEDIDERIQYESKFTQTDLPLPSLDKSIPLKITTPITRAQAKLQQQTTATPSNTTTDGKINELIPQGKAAIDNESTSDPLDENPNKIIPFDMNNLRQWQEKDKIVQDIKKNIRSKKNYFIENGMLLRKQPLSLPSVPFVPAGRIRADILKIYHDAPGNGAHFGRDETTRKIEERYHWPTMITNIRNHLNSCLPCAQNNHRRQKLPGALKPIKPPEGIWKLFSMDFHGPIAPTSKQGNRYIISLTDILSKFVVAKAVRDCSATTAVKFLINDVILKYGTPTCILTDNGTHFTAQIMNNLFQHLGVTHLYSTVYHPQTNGQIERFNATMDGKIAALCNERRTNWDEVLQYVTFNYNTSIHATTKQTPFEMMHGRQATLPFDQQKEIISLTQDPEHGEKIRIYLEKLVREARNNIIKNQQQYKTRYDLNRQNLSLKLNDLVLIKTRNIRNKFDIRYEGPFKIIKQLGIKTFIVQHVKKLTLTKQVTMDVIVPLVE